MSTALTITRSVTTLKDPDTVRIGGQLTRTDLNEPLPGRTVKLWGRRLSTGRLQPIATGTTDRDGYVSFTHAPRQHWAYQLRFPTNGVVIGDKSPERKVLFQPLLTGVMEDNGVPRGDSTRMVGTLSPYYQGRTIYLEKKISGDWTRVASKTLGAPSSTPLLTRFAFKVAPLKRTTHYYRVVFPAKTNVHLRAATPLDTLIVY